MQNSVTVRNAEADSYEQTIGASPLIKLFEEALPANCAAADAGSPIAGGELPADWLTAADAGAKAKSGTWALAGLVAAGTGKNAAHYRIYNNAGTVCHEQGTVKQDVALVTSALTAANGNVLTFAATTGVVAGMKASGTGVPAGAKVAAVDGTTVTLTHTSTAGVDSGATITFKGDMTLDNINIANNQVVTIADWSRTAGNA